MASQQVAVGVDIGGTRIKTVAVAPDGSVLQRRIGPTHDDAESLLQAVRNLIATVATTDAPVGISAPGIAALGNHAIAWMRGRMNVVEGLNWQQELSRECWVLNDAHAATIAEAWIGAARGATHAILLTLGTGVGGGVIIDGRLLQGATGRAGHLGHITLDCTGAADIVNMPGSLEDWIGNHSLRDRTGGRFRDTFELVQAVRSGNVQATECWQRSVRGLAVAVASLINAFDPQIVVIGGGIAECGPALFDLLRELMDEVEWRPLGKRTPIVPAELGEMAGAIGAARFAALQSENVEVAT